MTLLLNTSYMNGISHVEGASEKDERRQEGVRQYNTVSSMRVKMSLNSFITALLSLHTKSNGKIE